MRTITLIGGPHDGRTLSLPEHYTTLNMVEIERPGTAWMHTYDTRTGIWRSGRTTPNRPAIPARFTLFGPRVERLLARLDRP